MASADPTAARDDLARRVKALLAKAEATPFPDEAQAFAAKAQELITRHALDLGFADSDSPLVHRRVSIANPYVRPKAALLGAVAGANDCVVLLDGDGSAIVIGHGIDADHVITLFTSLLAQATRAMHAEGARRSIDGRSRTRSFRHAFLVGYAQQIAMRLADARKAAVADSPDALPVLAGRMRDAEIEARRSFGPTRTIRQTASSAGGFGAGRDAARRAAVGDGELAERSRSLPPSTSSAHGGDQCPETPHPMATSSSPSHRSTIPGRSAT